ncbi:hypothetical protein [Actinoplanes auranticolor]|uniref:Uncharacterized protein n=1 Tax=Actinoplanes auranticolor TaxID=47988 RepID=A0A919VIS5_9ACTN|nr:hypothetical protein [Actinoplanes auranticolor]GIM63349.1 hypothetical protein Aau02nite_03510 [Actinoplanes auranticolor]
MSSFPSRRTVLSTAVAGLFGVSVAACGGSGTGSSSGAAPTAVAATTGAAATPAGDSKTVSATDLCAFLEKNVSRWKAAGGEFAAMTQVTVELSSFYQEQGLVPPDAELDVQTRAECPDVRTEVLKTIGFDNFTEL